MCISERKWSHFFLKNEVWKVMLSKFLSSNLRLCERSKYFNIIHLQQDTDQYWWPTFATFFQNNLYIDINNLYYFHWKWFYWIFTWEFYDIAFTFSCSLISRYRFLSSFLIFCNFRLSVSIQIRTGTIGNE